jgi:Small protein found in certain Dnd DNA modification systems
MNDDGDLALKTLLAARLEAAPHLDEELLRQCYAIQKRYQFSDDRSLPASAMERLIDSKIAESSSDRAL